MIVKNREDLDSAIASLLCCALSRILAAYFESGLDPDSFSTYNEIYLKPLHSRHQIKTSKRMNNKKAHTLRNDSTAGSSGENSIFIRFEFVKFKLPSICT